MAMLNSLEKMVQEINDLYRYTLTKEKILRESRWNEWVQIVNKEEQMYLSVKQALVKIKKIKAYHKYNSLMQKTSDELTEKDKKENNTPKYFFCYFMTPFYGFLCDKHNKVVPYYEEYGHYTKNEFANYEEAIICL